MTRRDLALLLLLAAAVRALVALRTMVPGRDAEAYLWMAERVAEGNLGALFQTVFHPLYSLAVGAVIATGLAPVAAAQLVSCGCGALAVVPLARCADALFGPFAARVAGVLYALGIWFARHPADCLSEGPFFLLVAEAARRIALGPRGVRGGMALGACAGLAFGVRPEGAALVLLGAPWLWLRGERAAAAASALASALVAAPWIVGWTVHAGALTLTPKAEFNWEQGVGGAASALAHYAQHALHVPGASFEAIGYAALPLAVLGAWRARPLAMRGAPALLLALFLLQCAIVPLLRSNLRFLAGYGMLLLPFAGHGASALRARVAALPRAVQVALCLLAVAGDLVRIPQARRDDRVVEVELGAYLRERLRPGDRLVTEMPRLAYFAGQKPPPPRAIPPAEILRACRDPAVRCCAIVTGRTDVSPADLAALGFAPFELPEPLRADALARGVLVFVRE